MSHFPRPGCEGDVGGNPPLGCICWRDRAVPERSRPDMPTMGAKWRAGNALLSPLHPLTPVLESEPHDGLPTRRRREGAPSTWGLPFLSIKYGLGQQRGPAARMVIIPLRRRASGLRSAPHTVAKRMPHRRAGAPFRSL